MHHGHDKAACVHVVASISLRPALHFNLEKDVLFQKDTVLQVPPDGSSFPFGLSPLAIPPSVLSPSMLYPCTMCGDQSTQCLSLKALRP
jgi:hypothetical protein